MDVTGRPQKAVKMVLDIGCEGEATGGSKDGVKMLDVRGRPQEAVKMVSRCWM